MGELIRLEEELIRFEEELIRLVGELILLVGMILEEMTHDLPDHEDRIGLMKDRF